MYEEVIKSSLWIGGNIFLSIPTFLFTGDVPHICGGKDNSNTILDKCWKYDSISNQWIHVSRQVYLPPIFFSHGSFIQFAAWSSRGPKKNWGGHCSLRPLVFTNRIIFQAFKIEPSYLVNSIICNVWRSFIHRYLVAN